MTSLFVAGYLLTSIAAFGWTVGYFKGEYSDVPEDLHTITYGVAILYAILGPIGAPLSLILGGFAKHGWRLR